MRSDSDADLLAAVSGDADDATRHDTYLGAILARVREDIDEDELVLVESMECDYVDVLELKRQTEPEI